MRRRIVAAVAAALVASTVFGGLQIEAALADPDPTTTATDSASPAPSAPVPTAAPTIAPLVPGPATGPDTVVKPSSVPNSGTRIPMDPEPAAAAAATTGLASIGTLVAPAAAPSSTGWITSTAWNTEPTAHTATKPMPIFARNVALTQHVASATLTIAGLGVYAASVNGRPTSTAVLEPGASNTKQRVDYRTYDVTGLLATGTNRLAVQLATGMYDEVHTPGRDSKLVHIGGVLGFTARLDVAYADGSQTSFDTSRDWWARAGGTITADWYGGEDDDARQAPTGWMLPTTPIGTSTGATAGWAPAVVADIPASVALHAQTSPPVVAGTPVTAKSVRRISSTKVLVDFGTYVTGQPQVTTKAVAAEHIRIDPAERLKAGLPDQSTMHGHRTEPIYDSVTFATAGLQTWHPQFDYHGFRYMLLTASKGTSPVLDTTPSHYAVIPVHAALTTTGTVTTSDSTMNAIIRLTETSMTANLQAVPTDCPDREKLGWLEQDWLLFDLLAGRYDLSTYGKNLAQVIASAQRSDGTMPEIAPEEVSFGGRFSDDVNWGGALVFVPWKLYRTYGDSDTMSDLYPDMERYLDSIRTRSSGDLITFGLGDWITPAKGASSELTVSLGYYRVASTMAKIAAALGMTDDAADDAALAKRIAAAINAKFYKNGMYGSEQATNAMALELGIAPDPAKVRGALISLMAASGGYFDTGEIGLPSIFDALHDAGRDDLLWSAMMKPKAPSFAVFVKSGAVALPEMWSGVTGAGSLAHFMLGSPMMWAQDGLAGIDQTSTSVAYRNLLIRPAVFAGPASASATRTTPDGIVSVSWTRSGSKATVHLTVPAGSTAHVVLPTSTVDVANGSFTFTTSLGSRSSYGATTFRLASGTVTRLPWNHALYAAYRGTQIHLTHAEYQAMGYPKWKTALPAGSVVSRRSGTADLSVRTPDGAVHRMTHAEWVAVGRPRAA